jgi:hypothetical protein
MPAFAGTNGSGEKARAPENKFFLEIEKVLEYFSTD